MTFRRVAMATILILASPPLSHAQTAADNAGANRLIALPAVSADADPRRKGKAKAETIQVADTLQKITVEPGVNEIIQVAVGHPNRIVTPFKEPRVVTTAAASVETSENVIYVAPTGPALITMFLTETGDESVSISLTLQPKKIPPRELRLDLPAGVLVRTADKEKPSLAGERRAGNPRAYVARASQVFDELAKGSVPDGFAFSNQAPAPYPVCTPGTGYEVSFQAGQYLLGQYQEVYVGRVRNGGSHTATFEEPWCFADGVIAIALWPRATLQPGEIAEIYLSRAIANPDDLDPATRRPSLLQATSQ